MAIIIIRTIIVYFSLLLTMRLLGKRQLGEMELSEFVLAALIAALAALPLQDLGIPLTMRVKQMSKGTQEKVQLILVMSRDAKLYLLDEPIGGVDPATRDYILHTIISNYNPEASVIISTHLIADVEQILDEVVFIQRGQIVLQSSVDEIRETRGLSVDALFREEFKCFGNY